MIYESLLMNWKLRNKIIEGIGNLPSDHSPIPSTNRLLGGNRNLSQQKSNKILLLLGLIGFLANGDVYSAAPLLIKIAGDFNIQTSVAALSITSYMIAFGLFTVLIGPLGDRFGKSRIMLISSFGSAIFSCLCLFVSNINSLILIRFINGAFSAGLMPVSMAIIGEEFGEANRQTAIAKLMGMMTLGGASATIISGALAYFASWRMVYFIYGFAELLVAFLLLATLERQDGVLSKLNYFQVYRNVLTNNRVIWPVLTIVLLTGFSVFGSFAFSGELIKNAANADVWIIGLILAAFGAGGIAGSRLAMLIRPKLGNNICLIAGLIGAISLLAVSIVSNILWFVLAWFGFGISFIWLHSTMIMTAQSTRPGIRGTIMSLVSFGFFVGSGIGTLINRRFLEIVGVNFIFQVAAVIFLVLGLIALVTLNSIKRIQFKAN